MLTKYSRNLLVTVVCACFSGFVVGGVDGGVAEPIEPVETITTCDISRSFEIETSPNRIRATGNCDWRANLKSSRRLAIDFDRESPSKPDQNHRNGFGGPLCC